MMKKSADILQQIFSERNILQAQTNSELWNQLADSFLQSNLNEENLKIELQNNFPNSILTVETIHSIYLSYIEQLAENYVLNPSLFENDKYLLSHNDLFQNQIRYFQALKLAVINLKRKEIKNELNQKKNNDLDIDIQNLEKSIQIHSKQELKKKILQWDDELKEEKYSSILINSQSRGKTINMNWIKFSIAACFVLLSGFFVYRFYSGSSSKEQFNNQSITSKEKKIINDTLKLIDKQKSEWSEPEIKLAEVKVTETQKELITASYMGYASEEKREQLTIQFISTKKREESLKLAFSNDNKVYANELIAISRQKGKYLFNENVLKINDPKWKENNIKLLKLEDEIYLFEENEKKFYIIEKTSDWKSFQKVSNNSIIENLNKILFEND